MLALRLLLFVWLAAGLLPSCIGQPRLALSVGVPTPSPLFFIVLWLAALSVGVVVLTVFTTALHRRQRELLPPVARRPEA
jgi:hypothetical protein